MYFSSEIAKDFFLPDLSGLHSAVASIEALLYDSEPSILSDLQRLKIPLLWILTEPLLCLFSRNFPLFVVCRLWDFILCEGAKGLRATAAGIVVLGRSEFSVQTDDPMQQISNFQKKIQKIAVSGGDSIVEAAKKFLAHYFNFLV